MAATRELNDLIAAAQSGCVDSMMKCATICADKNSGHFSLDQAAYWYFQASKLKSEASAVLKSLAKAYPSHAKINYYYASYLLNLNNKDAYYYFEKAAKSGFSLAYIAIANRYVAGIFLDKPDFKIAANFLYQAAKCSTSETLKVLNPIEMLKTLALSQPTHDHDQVLANLIRCYEQGLCGVKSLPKSSEEEIYFLRLRAHNLFQALLQNRMHIDTNLYSILDLLQNIYAAMMLKHLDLLHKQPTNDKDKLDDVNTLIPILQMLNTVRIETLTNQKNLSEILTQVKLEAATDLLKFLEQYRVIVRGIESIDQRTKTYLLALKKDLVTRKFKVASYKDLVARKFKDASHLDKIEFVPGVPGGVAEIIDILKCINENSDAAEIRKAALGIRDAINKRDKNKPRDDGTIIFYNNCLEQLKACWLFTSVETVIEQRAAFLTSAPRAISNGKPLAGSDAAQSSYNVASTPGSPILGAPESPKVMPSATATGATADALPSLINPGVGTLFGSSLPPLVLPPSAAPPGNQPAKASMGL